MNISSEIDELSSTSIFLYEYLYGNVSSRICYYAVIALILFLAPLLCTSIVLYEHFGADRQKRTIINRLSSQFFINIAIQSIIWSIMRILRDVLGLLPTHLITPVIVVSNTMKLSSVLFLTELTVVRFLYIVVWKRMKLINDAFWNAVLMISTYLVAIFLALSVVLGRDHSYDMGHLIDLTYHEQTRYNLIYYNYIIL